MTIDLHPRFRKRVTNLNEGERHQVTSSLRALQGGFGLPHLHSGLGIRRLRKSLFECCAGLHWRIVFFAERGRITVYDVMTHDQLKAWLRKF